METQIRIAYKTAGNSVGSLMNPHELTPAKDLSSGGQVHSSNGGIGQSCNAVA